ncbi:MAG TPA: response regulator, partial [Elusimicrobiales bacterium]|nr:response regulator [Elusimicrobiales bacterium]
MTNKANILAVDDDASISELISSALSAEKYSVSVAYTGEEGVARFREGRFDLVIMDIQMPGMDGITALGEIKKISPDVEVVIATGHGTMGTAIQSLRKGAFDYLHKPFQISELLTVVERALEKKKFNDMTKAIFSTIRSEELLGIIIDSVTRMLKADESLLVLTDKTGTPYIANSYGLEEGARAEARLELCRRVLRRPPEKAVRAATLIDEPANVPGLSDIPGTEDIKFALMLPVMEGERLSGLININRLSPEEHFTENDLQRAAIFGSLANLALRNASLYRQLQETQSQLVQAEKMSALGQLAGGLAHEINNPLSGILGLTQLVMEQTAPA